MSTLYHIEGRVRGEHEWLLVADIGLAPYLTEDRDARRSRFKTREAAERQMGWLSADERKRDIELRVKETTR